MQSKKSGEGGAFGLATHRLRRHGGGTARSHQRKTRRYQRK
jgi:hypothetical protein